MDYKQTLDTLYNMMPDFQQVGPGAYKPGLERAIEFNRYLDNPDRSFISIHVAGTNGKGSVSHMLDSILRQAGYRTGLYTSPHMTDFRERIRVDGQMIPESYVVDFAASHLEKMEELRMSFFEATMGMAFRYFADSGIELAIIETGLGGRLDSTNIITPAVSIITNIGMDHMALLGNTLEKIADEKAGIIKHGVPVIIGESDPHSAPVFENAASKASSPIVFADRGFRCLSSSTEDGLRRFKIEDHSKGVIFEVCSDLMGDYQCKNIITVLAAVEALNRHTPLNISRRSILDGCMCAASSTGLRGRWQVVDHDPLMVLDAGHNEHGFRETMQQLGEQNYEKLYFILGVAADKNVEAIVALLPKDAYYIFTKASVERAMDSQKLAGIAMGAGLKGEVTVNVGEALARARKLAGPADMIFIGGSSFVVADALIELQ